MKVVPSPLSQGIGIVKTFGTDFAGSDIHSQISSNQSKIITWEREREG